MCFLVLPALSGATGIDVLARKYPGIEKHVVFFAATSVEREIQYLREARENQFTAFAKLIDKGIEPAKGIKTDDDLRNHLNSILKRETLHWEDFRKKMPKGSQLYYIHIRDEKKSCEAWGYIVISDGKVVIEDTASVLEKKYEFMATPPTPIAP